MDDVVVIGAGIIGLATALQLLEQCPALKVTVLEKEEGPAHHQTGNNSGVIHSGIYYKPGLLKEFCEENFIPYKLCGKVIVATKKEELGRLQELHKRGTANGVADLEMIGPERLKEIEPHVQGIAALHAPHTGIIDYRQVAKAYGRQIQQRGGRLLFGEAVKELREGEVVTEKRVYQTRLVVNCGGLHADRIAKWSDKHITTDQICPFRGEYYFLKPAAEHLVNTLIYPVPDPAFPFLGVHLTSTIDGRVEAGPNAVLALAREGYRKSDVNVRDLAEMLSFGGFWRLAGRYWRTGLSEVWRSFSKRAFLKALQRFVPELTSDDLCSGGAGVRAQLLSNEGKVVDDFSIVERPSMIHVLSAPSPGATASLSIGLSLSERCLDRLNAKVGVR
jgi:L-2-hydroxyglutarate oxidase